MINVRREGGMGYETKYTYVVIYREHARIKWCDLDKVSKLSKSVVVISRFNDMNKVIVKLI